MSIHPDSFWKRTSSKLNTPSSPAKRGMPFCLTPMISASTSLLLSYGPCLDSFQTDDKRNCRSGESFGVQSLGFRLTGSAAKLKHSSFKLCSGSALRFSCFFVLPVTGGLG